jgi:sensor histidine kinase YesM
MVFSIRMYSQRKLPVFLRDAAITVAFCIVVALILMMVQLAALQNETNPEIRNQALAGQLIYSLAIGLSIFSLIELPRLTRWWGRPPALLNLTLVVAGAIPLGYMCGSALGSWFTASEFRPLLDAGPFMLFIGLVTVLTSLLSVHFLTHRDHLAAERMRAETADLRAKNAQLQLLQQQIEPHMLFNTLANIHALTETDPPRAQSLIEALSELLHASMQLNLQQRVTLAQEFALLKNYLQVISIRMGARLSYSLSLPSDLEQIMVPPLLVQPLVENAVKHGISPKLAGGTINVAARGDERQLIIEITDDGLGLRGEDPFSSGRIGLSNVRRRLGLAFDDRASLSLCDYPPHGARATLSIPR